MSYVFPRRTQPLPIVPLAKAETDEEKLWKFDDQIDAVRELGLSEPLVAIMAWAYDFIWPILQRRLAAVEAPHGYSPIEELPDVTHRRVVLYNSCNGPHLDSLVLDEDAQRYRDEGCWTHFLLLPESPATPQQ